MRYVKKTKIMLYFIFISIIIAVLIIILSMGSVRYNEIAAENGIADARDIDFKNSDQFKITGSWEFYENKFLSPQDFSKDTDTFVYKDIKNRDETNGDNLAAGTYRLRILKSETAGRLGIKLPYTRTVYNAYINGIHIGSDNNQASIEQIVAPHIYHIDDGAEFIEIIIQAVNQNFGGGITQELMLGSSVIMQKDLAQYIVLYIFVYSSVTIMFILALIFLFSRKLFKNLAIISATYIFFAIHSVLTIIFLILGTINLHSDTVLFLGGGQVVKIAIISELEAVYFMFEYFLYDRGNRFKRLTHTFRALNILICLVFILAPLDFLISYLFAGQIYIAAVSSAILYIATKSLAVSFNSTLVKYANGLAFFICNFLSIIQIYLFGFSVIFSLGFLIIYLLFLIDLLQDYVSTKQSLEQLKVGLEAEIENRTFELIEVNGALQNEVEARRKAEDDLLKITTIDYLTGVSNRMEGQRCIDNLINLFNRYGHGFSILLIDIDNFKAVNDTYGHAIGDKTLIAMTQNIQNALRSTDTLARWGGEEFIIIIPNCNLSNAINVGEKIRKSVAKAYFEGPETVTVSIGVAEMQRGENSKSLTKMADENLYKAKRSGKNRTYPARAF